jgi:hypothetical protein
MRPYIQSRRMITSISGEMSTLFERLQTEFVEAVSARRPQWPSNQCQRLPSGESHDITYVSAQLYPEASAQNPPVAAHCHSR